MSVRTPGVWGIDLGQCALKAIRLELKDGEVVATAFEYIEHPKILSQPDADPDELTAQALSQFLERNNIRGDQVAISVAGQSGLARFVKLPPVDEKKIADIVKFEAKQQIPFPLDEVIWDFQRLYKGDIIDGMALETEIGLFAMKKDVVHRVVNQYKKVGVEIHCVQMAPLALCNFIAYDRLGKSADQGLEDGEESQECVVGLEIGTDNSNLIITNGGRIIWQRPIPIGGNHFTRALTKELKLTFAKAEHLKRNAAKSPELKKILSALRQVLNDFVAEVQRSLGYFTNTHRNAQISYMIGLGNAFRLPGLQKFLQEKLQLEVRKFGTLEKATGDAVIAAPTFAENVMGFGVAYGLALQGLDKARLQTNLLPQEIKTERLIRAKKPWMVAAAACLLFALGLLAFGRGVEIGAVENPDVVAKKKELDDMLKKVSGFKTQMDAQDDRIRKKTESLNQIGAGVNERFNWQLLHQYINMATPQPNGDRLVAVSENLKPVLKDYWSANEQAKKAFDLYEKKRFGIKDSDNPVENRKNDKLIKEHLVQINILGINALYSEDLPAYFRKLYADGAQLPGMSLTEQKLVKDHATDESNAEKKKLLPEKGWVIEIRGYTYHKGNIVFVENTITENLKHPDKMKTADGKDIVIPPEVNEQVTKKVGFLTVYKNEMVKTPVAGQFNLIGKSVLKTLLRGDVAGGGGLPGVPIKPAEPGGNPGQGDAKPSRDQWRPIGEMATQILADGGGGGVGPGFPKMPNPPLPPPQVGDSKTPAVLEQPVPRTEFILLLVWQEPITGVAASSEPPGAVPAVPAAPPAKGP
jgi:type IV pilus assembly protein PilM